MKQYRTPLTLAIISFFLVMGCDLIEYHPYDIPVNNKYSNLNQKSIEQLLASEAAADDTVRFIFMGDTQRKYDETEAFVKSANKQKGIDFVVHGGDISDFGMSKEYIWMHEILKKLTAPYVTIIGNHDIIGQGKEVYQLLYGAYNFAFTYRGVKFLFLNTNALEYDYSVPVPDYTFMLNQLSDSVVYKSTVVMMHVPPFDFEFNNNTVYYFEELVRRFKNPLFCAHAHTHKLTQQELFNDGITYYGCNAIAEKSYLVFTIINNSYTCDIVYF